MISVFKNRVRSDRRRHVRRTDTPTDNDDQSISSGSRRFASRAPNATESLKSPRCVGEGTTRFSHRACDRTYPTTFPRAGRHFEDPRGGKMCCRRLAGPSRRGSPRCGGNLGRGCTRRTPPESRALQANLHWPPPGSTKSWILTDPFGAGAASPTVVAFHFEPSAATAASISSMQPSVFPMRSRYAGGGICREGLP